MSEGMFYPLLPSSCLVCGVRRIFVHHMTPPLPPPSSATIPTPASSAAMAYHDLVRRPGGLRPSVLHARRPSQVSDLRS